MFSISNFGYDLTVIAIQIGITSPPLKEMASRMKLMIEKGLTGEGLGR